MIIIGISGGLGNQMFQFALYKKFKQLEKDVKIDLSFYNTKQELRKFELENIFEIDYALASRHECKKLGVNSYNISDKIYEKIFKTKDFFYLEDIDKGFQPEIFSLEDAYLSGYWQNEKYFIDIRKEIINTYHFPPIENHYVKTLQNNIENSESVAVHIRRGDYLDEQNYKVYGNICTIDYYKKAIKYMEERCDSPEFFIFSNDQQWVKERFSQDNITVVEDVKDKMDYEDMYLMSRCKHNIIANSSFSWWSAWLNQNNAKIVISPAKWFNNHKVTEPICSDWIKVESMLYTF